MFRKRVDTYLYIFTEHHTKTKRKGWFIWKQQVQKNRVLK